VHDITYMNEAKLIMNDADAHTPREWAEAIGRFAQGVRALHDGVNEIASTDQPGVRRHPPRHSPGPLICMPLQRLREVLSLVAVTDIPDQIMPKKYFGSKLARGQVPGSVKGPRRVSRGNHPVREKSSVKRCSRGGAMEEAVVAVFSAVHHYAVKFVAGKLMAFARIECVASSADRRRTYGQPEKCRDTDCCESLRAWLRYVDGLAIEAVTGTSYVRSQHAVLICRERCGHER